jgi:hypothetical protein
VHRQDVRVATARADYLAVGVTGVAAMVFAFLSMASSAACLTGVLELELGL